MAQFFWKGFAPVASPLLTAFPGQPGNPVGFAATPALAPARWTVGSWPGAYPGSLTSGSGPFSSGTPSSPTIIAFKDFQNGTTTLTIGAHDIIFVGCRFAYNTPNNSSGTNNVNLSSTDYNVQFFYCTWMPLSSFGYTSPPGGAWPSSGAGQNTVTQVNNVNAVDGASGYQFALGAYSTSTNGSFMVQSDHCDFWAMGNGAVDTIGTTNQQNYYDCWIHDCCDAVAVGYHQDGIGYFDGGTPPANILIQHCTISTVGGNANAIAFQAATSPYSGIKVINNYLSGYNNNLDLGHVTAGSTNLICTDNIFGTDVQWVNSAIYADPSTLFTQSSNPTNLWRRNKLLVLPGTTPNSGSSPSWTSANNGQFLWPDSTLNATDWPN